MSDFDHNPRGRQAVIISAFFAGLALIIVLLRLYTRLVHVRSPGVEDVGVVLAMICSIGLVTCIGFQARWGMGQHIRELQPETMQHSLKAFWVSLIVYNLALGLTKTSMLLQYRRVFTTEKFWKCNYVVMAVVVCYTITTVFTSIFACVPVRAFWTREDARCMNQFASWFSNAAFNIATDFAIIILPMPVIRNLNLNRRQKNALIGIFAVGGAVCLVSILRLQSLVSISNSTDPTYDNPPAATWSSVEVNIGIICSCLPLLRPLVVRWLPDSMSSNKRSLNSKQRLYAAMNVEKNRKHIKSQSEYDLESTWTKKDATLVSQDDTRDIQVVTNIEVQVDGDDATLSRWATPTTGQSAERGAWTDEASAKEMRNQSSAENLV